MQDSSCDYARCATNVRMYPPATFHLRWLWCGRCNGKMVISKCGRHHYLLLSAQAAPAATTSIGCNTEEATDLRPSLHDSEIAVMSVSLAQRGAQLIDDTLACGVVCSTMRCHILAASACSHILRRSPTHLLVTNAWSKSFCTQCSASSGDVSLRNPFHISLYAHDSWCCVWYSKMCALVILQLAHAIQFPLPGPLP